MGLSFYDLKPEEQLHLLRRVFRPDACEINFITGCYELKQHTNSSGYGNIGIYGQEQRKNLKIHRAIFEFLSESRIPENSVVMHKCDNPRCINMKHLSLGTAKENMQDMAKKGRSGKIKGQRRRKLAEWQVIEIKGLLANGVPYSQISKIYNVSIGAISCIKNGRNWKHVQLPIEA